MSQPDSWSGSPGADALPRYERPAFDSNRRWYDEYLQMMNRANEHFIDQIRALQYAGKLREVLTDVLDETAGGNFLSAPTRERAQGLLHERPAMRW
jgi:hypothetical protein